MGRDVRELVLDILPCVPFYYVYHFTMFTILPYFLSRDRFYVLSIMILFLISFLFLLCSLNQNLRHITNTRYPKYTIVTIHAHGSPYVLNVEGRGPWTVF